MSNNEFLISGLSDIEASNFTLNMYLLQNSSGATKQSTPPVLRLSGHLSLSGYLFRAFSKTISHFIRKQCRLQSFRTSWPPFSFLLRGSRKLQLCLNPVCSRHLLEMLMRAVAEYFCHFCCASSACFSSDDVNDEGALVVDHHYDLSAKEDSVQNPRLANFIFFCLLDISFLILPKM